MGIKKKTFVNQWCFLYRIRMYEIQNTIARQKHEYSIMKTFCCMQWTILKCDVWFAILTNSYDTCYIHVYTC